MKVESTAEPEPGDATQQSRGVCELSVAAIESRKINQALGGILNAFSVGWQPPCRGIADGWQMADRLSR